MNSEVNTFLKPFLALIRFFWRRKKKKLSKYMEIESVGEIYTDYARLGKFS